MVSASGNPREARACSALFYLPSVLNVHHSLIFGLVINMLTSLLLMALGVLNTPDVCEDNGTLSILKILNIRRALKAAVTLLRKEFRNGLWSFSACFLAFRSEKRDDNVVPGLVHVEFRVPWGFCI